MTHNDPRTSSFFVQLSGVNGLGLSNAKHLKVKTKLMQNPFFLNASQALQAHQLPNPPQPSNEGLPSPQCVRSGPRGKGLD